MRDQKIDSHERLVHIQEAILKIEEFTQNISEEKFLNDQLIVSAVLFQFSVIGEAVNHIDDNILSKYYYPWHKVRAFRNLISHVYFQIKPEAVWNVIAKDLPELLILIESILKNEY